MSCPPPDGGRHVRGVSAGALSEGGKAPGGDASEGALFPTTPGRRTAFAARMATFLKKTTMRTSRASYPCTTLRGTPCLGWGNSLVGVAFYITQTPGVVARTGYHPSRMVGVAAPSVGVYLALSEVMGTLVMRSICRRPWHRRLPPPPLDEAAASSAAAAGDARPVNGAGWEWEKGRDATAVAAPAGKPQSVKVAELGRLWRRRPDCPPRAPGGEASEGWLPGEDEPPTGA